MIVCLAIFCLTVFAVLDQTTTLYANILFPDWNDYTKYYATREEAIEEYNSDNQFVQKIEYEMEEGDMIFQLPIIAGTTLQNFPNGVPNGYDLLKPYIHSTKLRWSFGDKVGGKTDQWLTQIQSQSIDLLLQEIGIKGFKGLYIDSRGYSKNVFTDIINYLEEETGVIPLIDTKKGIYFYNLSSYFEEKSYTNTHDENVVDLNSIYTRYNIDGKTVENIKTGEIVNFYVFINHKGEYSLKLRTEGNVMPEVRLCYEYNGTKISLTAQKQEEGMYTFIVPVRDGELCVELANNSDSDVNIYREEIIYVQDIQD